MLNQGHSFTKIVSAKPVFGLRTTEADMGEYRCGVFTWGGGGHLTNPPSSPASDSPMGWNFIFMHIVPSENHSQ